MLQQMIVDTGQKGGGGGRLTNHQYFVLKVTMIFFHTANQTLDSLHNGHSAVCTTYDMCTCHQLSKKSRHAVTFRKAYKYETCISLTHTHMHMALCMHTVHVAACLQLCPPPPLVHSNRMPQRMYASVPRCMPIAMYVWLVWLRDGNAVTSRCPGTAAALSLHVAVYHSIRKG